MKELKCYQDFSHYKSMGFFFRRSRAANSALLGRIWPKFEFVRDIVVCDLYSFVVYLNVNGSGTITSVGKERANLSAVVYL